MIFHKYKLIVTGISKNASTSIHVALRNPTDHEHNHRSLMDDYNNNDSELMDHYLNLAVVRNPYDRLISSCWQIRRDNPDQNWNLTINEIINREIINWADTHDYINEVFIPQHKFICFGKKLLADVILTYENLHNDWEKFAIEYNKTSTFQIPIKLPQFNQSLDRKVWQEELKEITQENLDFINTKYKLDFEIFNYSMINKVPK
jgi:hypothetical protein